MTHPTPKTLVDNLKPCPFCGGKATVIDGGYSQSPPFYVMCKNRLAENPCQCEMWRVHSRDEAIKRWNTRQHEPEPVSLEDCIDAIALAGLYEGDLQDAAGYYMKICETVLNAAKVKWR